LEEVDFQHNRTLIADIGLLNAERADYGRIRHRETELSVADALNLLRNWRWGTFSPGWDYEAVLDAFERIGSHVSSVPLTLMQYENEDRPRERSWTDAAGFNNLFQGKDLNMQSANAYPGDAAVPFGTGDSQDDRLAIQVHYVRPKGFNIDLYTLAIFLGGQSIVKRRTL
jgi:hypothetical protein